MWRAPLALFLLYRELFSDRELFTDRELRDARMQENFTTLPDAALLLHHMWHTHCVCQAPLALFLLYHELFSDRELFTNLELCAHGSHMTVRLTNPRGEQS